MPPATPAAGPGAAAFVRPLWSDGAMAMQRVKGPVEGAVRVRMRRG
ncbi:hypothetical protein [Methylobacterium terricola]|nr:hypothetical protein [Methylobacterium terricola]